MVLVIGYKIVETSQKPKFQILNHLYFKVTQSELSQLCSISAMPSLFLLFSKCADPDETWWNAASCRFGLGLHWLPMYMFTGLQNEKLLILYL